MWIRCVRMYAIAQTVAICLIGCCGVANAQEFDTPACKQTPGSSPQYAMWLGDSSFTPASSEIEILSDAGDRTLRALLKRVILVPVAGPIDGVELLPINSSISSSIRDGRRVSSINIKLALLPPDGTYRVLVEVRDLSAPQGCSITFINAIGSLTVHAVTGG